MKQVLSSLVAMVLMTLSLGFFAVAPAHAGADKIKVCHATGSDSNPYVYAEPNLNAFLTKNDAENGHSGHELDIYDSLQYTDKSGELRKVERKNWGLIESLGVTGESIYMNGCVVEKETPQPKVVTPVAPIYTPGTCINPNGSVDTQNQPEGVIPPVAPTLLDGKWVGTLHAAEGYVFSNGDVKLDYSFDVIPPTEDCTLPEMGAGTTLLVAGGGALLLGLGGAALYFSRRKEA